MRRARRWWRLLVPAALLAAAAAPAGGDAGPEAYRVRTAIRPGAGATVQRLSLPASAAAAAQTADLSDVRVFDADGRPMPMARAAPAERRTPLASMPILGAADALEVRGVSLTLDGEGRARVAQVNGTPARGEGSTLVGVLLDARQADGEAKALTLEAAIPEGQPVTLAVAASNDLSNWRALGERTLYRPPGSAPVAAASVPLGAASLRGDYLRVTWDAATRLLAPVQVRTATLVGRPATAPSLRQVAATVPPLGDRHLIDVALPFATPIATLRVTPAGDDLVVPVRILGRDTDEQPWTPLGSGLATREAGGRAPGIALSGATFRMLRIEAEDRSPGFSAPPILHFGLEAPELLFLAAGRAPFTLAAGRSGAVDAYLPADSLLRAGGSTVANAEVADAAAVLHLSAPDGDKGGRKLLLWAVLLGATGLLAVLAWLLWRRGTGIAPA